MNSVTSKDLRKTAMRTARPYVPSSNSRASRPRSNLLRNFIFIALAIPFLNGIFRGEAAIVNATNCSFAAVSAAVTSALPGDTVQLPAGTNVWTQTVNLSGISLRGAGTNQTIIIDEVSRANNGGQLFMLTGNPAHLTELSNLQLLGGTTTSYNYFGTVVCTGTPSTSWRVDHILFNGLYSKNIVTYGNAFNVIDHNTFLMRAIAIEDNGYIQNDDTGDQSYALPPTYGLDSSNALYIEDNYFTNIVGAPAGVSDGEVGARVVFRHNTVWNEFFANHGCETGGRWRSERSFEVYNNTFTFSPSAPGYPYYTMANIRGGSGVIYSNTANGYVSIFGMRNFRSTDAYNGQWYPFGGANGTNPWDSNSPTLYLSGKSTGPNGAGYLQVSGAHWTNNQWYAYTLVNTNSGWFSVVNSNSADTMYFLGAGLVQSHAPMTFNTGDGFKLYLVYATLDQPGRGSGDLLRDNGMDASNNEVVINTATGKASWPDEVLEPIYFWSNTLNGANAEASSSYPNIKAGRDFYNDTPKPGYVPYRYPHPLAVASQPPGRPAPPVNLKTGP
ncbi:MAG: hypothetical protein ACREFE_01325 [Limisphaerales bacterium]